MRTTDKVILVVGCVVMFGLVAWGISAEIGLWRECRTDHGFLYCARVLGH